MSVRFAPSPTGRFHLGNLRTAWISHWWAQALNLPWVLRFEDIDIPRNVAGAAEGQLKDMEILGLKSYDIRFQSDRRDRHWAVFLRFLEEGLVYPCFCSRKRIRESVATLASAPHGAAPTYNGACRDLKQYPATSLPTIAWRAKTADAGGKGDFIIGRTSPRLHATGPDPETYVPAYTWACAVDDWDGDHALLVRAWDLEEVLGQQRWIQERLSRLEGKPFAPPAIYHCSLVTADDGGRLEKRTRGITIPELIAGGETPETIVEKFLKGFFADTADFEKGKSFGEPKRSVTLGELGFEV